MQPGETAGSLAMKELRPVNDSIIGIKRQDGSLYWVNSNAAPLLNSEGKLEGVVSTFTDITRRKQAEDELILSLEKIKHNQKLLLGLVRASEAIQRTRSSYQQVYQIIGEEIAELGFHTTIFTLSKGGTSLELQYYNVPDSIIKAATKLTGLSPLGFSFPLKPGGFFQRLLDREEVVLVNPFTDPLNEMLPGHIRPFSKKLASIIELDYVIYAPLIVNNQSFGVLSVNGSGLSEDDIPAMKTFSAHASIAIENTILFDTERAGHQQMVELTNYLQVVREEERTYMAREIHDEFGQRLTALKMDISWLTHHLPSVDIAVVEKVDAMDNLVDESIQLVRQVAADLRPGLLDDLGLTAALDWQAQDFT
jgi:signal transduction histidine kinase